MRQRQEKLNTDGSIRVSSLNVGIFDDINTEEKAYWLGFIAADGNVSSSRHYFEISLQKGDRDHLEKLRNFLGISAPLSETKHAFRLQVGDRDFRLSLISRGIVPKKSGILEYPIRVPEYLTKHLLRGYVDGNGSIYTRERYVGKPTLYFNLVGTEPLLRKLMEQVNIPLTLFKDKRWKDQGVYYVTTAYRKAIDICSYLYNDSTVYLERKHSKFCSFIEQSISNNRAISVEAETANTEISSQISKG